MKHKHKLYANFLLILTTFFWGITFVIVKEAVEQVGVFFFLAQRFGIAFFILLSICLMARRPFSSHMLKQGVILGTLLFTGFAFQTLALLYTTASNTAFLTGLNVVLVPSIAGLFFGHIVTQNLKWGVCFATVGLYLLCANDNWVFNNGDLLGVICAIAIALHIIYTGKYARLADVYWLTTIQIGVIALLSTSIATFNGNNVFEWHPEIMWAIIICVLFATIFAFLVQTAMQRFISPTNTALIFCMEPVFAAICAYFMAGERLGIKGIIGAVLILSGMLLSEISFPDLFFKKEQVDEN